MSSSPGGGPSLYVQALGRKIKELEEQKRLLINTLETCDEVFDTMNVPKSHPRGIRMIIEKTLEEVK